MDSFGVSVYVTSLDIVVRLVVMFSIPRRTLDSVVLERTS